MTPRSPWRYPGGKTRMAAALAPALLELSKDATHWVDPFVGGGGSTLPHHTSVALPAVLCDSDVRVASWWDIVTDPDPRRYNELIELIKTHRPTVASHDAMQAQQYTVGVPAALAGIVLNRTSFSGILNGSPIGGREQQSKWAVDCRWNPERQVKMHHAVRELMVGTEVHYGDYFDVLEQHHLASSLLVLDPPYVEKGDQLYAESFRVKDHLEFGAYLLGDQRPWLLTYNDHELVRNMFIEKPYRVEELDVRYSSPGKKTGHKKDIELVVVHDPNGRLKKWKTLFPTISQES